MPELRYVLAGLCVTLALFEMCETAPSPWIASRQKPRDEKHYTVCESDACMRLSKLLRAQIDASVEPCSDFYRHACGGFNARHTPKGCDALTKALQEEANPPDGSEYRIQMAREIIINATLARMYAPNTDGKIPETEPLKRMKQFHQSCLAWSTSDPSANDAQTMSYIQNFAKWPFFNRGSWHTADFDVIDVMARLSSYGIGSLFELGIGQDLKDATKMSLYLMPPKTFTLASNHRAVIAQLFADLGKSIGIDAAKDKATLEWLRQEVILPVITFEEDLAAHILQVPTASLEKAKFLLKHYNQLTFRDLDKVFLGTGINWQHFFGVVFRKSPKYSSWEDVPEKESLLVVVQQLPYFQHLAKVLTKIPRHAVANYFLLKLVLGLSNALGGIGDETTPMPAYAKIDKPATSSVIRSCFSQLEKYFAEPLSAYYGAARISWDKKMAVEDLFHRVHLAAHDMFKENKWMSRAEKEALLEKLFELNYAKNVGYVHDDSMLSGLLEKWEAMQRNSSFLDNVMIGMEIDLKPLFDPKDRRDYGNKYPTTVMTAAHFPTWNGLVMSAGSFEYPLYDEQWPLSYNLGLSGVTMGHEIFHAFDNYGIGYGPKGERLVDAYGRPQQLWKNFAVLQESMSCLEKAYNSYCLDISLDDQCIPALSAMQPPVSEAVLKNVKDRRRVCINGSSTLGENMADFNGIRAAWKALKEAQKWDPQEVRLPGLEMYSTDQLFFLGASFYWCGGQNPLLLAHRLSNDVHSPNEARVNQVTRMFPEFSNAFNCRSKIQSENVCIMY